MPKPETLNPKPSTVCAGPRLEADKKKRARTTVATVGNNYMRQNPIEFGTMNHQLNPVDSVDIFDDETHAR